MGGFEPPKTCEHCGKDNPVDVSGVQAFLVRGTRYLEGSQLETIVEKFVCSRQCALEELQTHIHELDNFKVVKVR